MEKFPDISMSVSKGHACIHYSSETNIWIDFLVIVPNRFVDDAKTAILKAIGDLWNKENCDKCYGNIVEHYLNDLDIPFVILYRSDDEEDEEYENWWNKTVLGGIRTQGEEGEANDTNTAE